MPVTNVGNATQAATIGTEHTLQDVALAGVYVFTVDMFNLALGDIVELRVYQIVRTGGTRRVCYEQSFSGVQPTDDMIKKAPPIDNDLTDAGSLRFTLKQTAGTGRNFDWKVNAL